MIDEKIKALARELTDQQWGAVFGSLIDGGDPDGMGLPWCQARALLAYVRELAGKVADDQRDNMEHALGRKARYRNYFVASNDSADWASWAELHPLGLADWRPYQGAMSSTVFAVTALGRAVLRVLEAER